MKDELIQEAMRRLEKIGYSVSDNTIMVIKDIFFRQRER